MREVRHPAACAVSSRHQIGPWKPDFMRAFPLPPAVRAGASLGPGRASDRGLFSQPPFAICRSERLKAHIALILPASPTTSPTPAGRQGDVMRLLHLAMAAALPVAIFL